MPLPAVEECPTAVCLPCQRRERQTRFGHRCHTATFRREHQNCSSADSILDLSCPASMPHTQLPRFAQTPQPRRADAVVTLNVRSLAELMWRIEDAAKNQTARNPESTVLDPVDTSGRQEEDEDRDGGS